MFKSPPALEIDEGLDVGVISKALALALSLHACNNISPWLYEGNIIDCKITNLFDLYERLRVTWLCI